MTLKESSTIQEDFDLKEMYYRINSYENRTIDSYRRSLQITSQSEYGRIAGLSSQKQCIKE